MNKSERLTDLLLYLSDKRRFNLADIMRTYAVSKRTAIRDVQALEALGMPIFVERGREGGYGILGNRLLAPITFSLDELQALYLSLLTLAAYQSSPFKLEIKSLEAKFLKSLSAAQQERLLRTRQCVQLDQPAFTTEAAFLKDLLSFCLEKQVIALEYGQAAKTYTVLPLLISARFGQWYLHGLDLSAKALRIFRVDKITSLALSEQEQSPSSARVAEMLNQSAIKRSQHFCAELDRRGRDLFIKESYPSMSLALEGGKIFLKGSYAEAEIGFVVDYLLGFGCSLLSLRPKKLLSAMLQRNAEHRKNLEAMLGTQ
ncbi:MAG: WYL domain-containing protein [Anaerolineaceae bacterium]|nr:WYL domain-containing protein [Anaerolineaceae bacterium]